VITSENVVFSTSDLLDLLQGWDQDWCLDDTILLGEAKDSFVALETVSKSRVAQWIDITYSECSPTIQPERMLFQEETTYHR
jgi:hypothetical protein